MGSILLPLPSRVRSFARPADALSSPAPSHHPVTCQGETPSPCMGGCPPPPPLHSSGRGLRGPRGAAASPTRSDPRRFRTGPRALCAQGLSQPPRFLVLTTRDGADPTRPCSRPTVAPAIAQAGDHSTGLLRITWPRWFPRPCSEPLRSLSLSLYPGRERFSQPLFPLRGGAEGRVVGRAGQSAAPWAPGSWSTVSRFAHLWRRGNSSLAGGRGNNTAITGAGRRVGRD